MLLDAGLAWVSWWHSELALVSVGYGCGFMTLTVASLDSWLHWLLGCFFVASLAFLGLVVS